VPREAQTFYQNKDTSPPGFSEGWRDPLERLVLSGGVRAMNRPICWREARPLPLWGALRPAAPFKAGSWCRHRLASARCPIRITLGRVVMPRGARVRRGRRVI